MIRFELVLPCYNESRSLEILINRAKTAAETAGFKAGEFKLVLVENGSTDSSRQVLKDLSKNNILSPWFKLVTIDQNQGYGYGLYKGLQATESEVIGWSHADQQCDPADAIKAYFQYQELTQNGNAVLIKGERSGRNWKDILVSRVFEWISKIILGLHVYEINAQPKVFARPLLNKLISPPMNFAFDLYVLYQAQKMGLTFHTIPVVFPPRVHGLSNWSSHFLSRYKTILGMIRYMWTLSQKEGRL